MPNMVTICTSIFSAYILAPLGKGFRKPPPEIKVRLFDVEASFWAGLTLV